MRRSVVSSSCDKSPQPKVAANGLPGAERLPVIGLVGGVASGKSFVAAELARLGAAVLDADRAGHQVLTDPVLIAEIRQEWGPDVLDDAGQVDRKALADIVFEPTDQGRGHRARLEQITHPRIGQLILEQARKASADPNVVALVLDAPVMLEAGWGDLCQHVLFVDAPTEVRLRRVLERGWTAEEFAVRENAQQSLKNKRTRADFVIDNSGDPEYTRAQVETFWKHHFG